MIKSVKAIPATLSGYSDGTLTLGVLGCEIPERFARLVELVGLLDGHPEPPLLEKPRESLQVLRAQHRPYVVALRSFAGRGERRGTAPVVFRTSAWVSKPSGA